VRRSKYDWRENAVCHVCKKPFDPEAAVRVPARGFPAGVSWRVCSMACAERYAAGATYVEGD